jgi:hypothetical protein
MKRRIVCCLAMAIAVAFCFLKSYEVLPTQASWSGWAPQQGYVGNTFTANFDSICYCEVFIGYLGANPTNPFDLDVYEYPGGIDPVASAHNVVADKYHDWLMFNLSTASGKKFVRGKEYLLKVTRPDDSA